MASTPASPALAARFRAFWEQLLGAFDTHKHLWAATFEIFTQLDRMPELRKMIAEGTEEARREWATLFQGIDAAADPATAHAVGSVYHALLAGVLAQWLTDPGHAPSAAQLVAGLRAIGAGFAKADAEAAAGGEAGAAAGG